MENDSSQEDKTGIDSGDNETACLRCGTCCMMHQAFVNPEEIRRIIAFLSITTDDWERDYDDSRWEYNNYRLIRHIDGACAFLKYENGLATCTIHSVKPACCANWQPGPDRKECREGAAKRTGSLPAP